MGKLDPTIQALRRKRLRKYGRGPRLQYNLDYASIARCPIAAQEIGGGLALRHIPLPMGEMRRGVPGRTRQRSARYLRRPVCFAAEMLLNHCQDYADGPTSSTIHSNLTCQRYIHHYVNSSLIQPGLQSSGLGSSNSPYLRFIVPRIDSSLIWLKSSPLSLRHANLPSKLVRTYNYRLASQARRS